MQNAKRARSVAAPTSVAAGAATDVSDLISVTVNLTAVGTATYQGQISMDGSTWANQGAALTANGSLAVPDGTVQFRWNCTAYTSGTPTSTLGGVKAMIGQDGI
jgi:hypothetical protein